MTFLELLKKMDLALPVEEYEFHPTSKYRFDYAWPLFMIALEVEGGIHSGGRHTSSVGFLKDMKKYNEAALLGWRVLRTTPKTLVSLGTAAMLKRCL